MKLFLAAGFFNFFTLYSINRIIKGKCFQTPPLDGALGTANCLYADCFAVIYWFLPVREIQDPTKHQQAQNHTRDWKKHS